MQQAHSRRVPVLTTIESRFGVPAQESDGALTLFQVKKRRKKSPIAVTCGLLFCLPMGSVYSSPLVSVTFSGDNGHLSNYYGEITNDLNYAATDWENIFVSGNASALNVDVIFDNSATANSSSLFATPLYSIGPLSVFQQGAVGAVMNGVHNPSGPYDAAIHIGTSYLTNELWFDPNPANTDGVPAGKTDAESVFLHEFGHIFGFQGYRDQSTGALWSNAESTFDVLMSFLNNAPYFTGSDAESLYGGPIPLTVGNIYHVGNPSGPGADLEAYPGDLMNGNVFYRGTRYNISPIDAAIFADLGLTTEIPEPGTIGIFCVSLVGFWLAHRWSPVNSQNREPSTVA